MVIHVTHIYCPACGKYTKMKTDNIEPLDLMCNECNLVIASIKTKGKESYDKNII